MSRRIPTQPVAAFAPEDWPMTFRIAAISSLLALVLSVHSDRAQAQPSRAPISDGLVLVAVDGVERAGETAVYVEGLAVGESEVKTYSIFPYSPEASDACERYALLMMSRPGRYQLVFRVGPRADYTCALRAAP